ncbi:MAG: trigger factor [Spirochaetaceae bacterium]|nr:trigger factor [Spirochaetaceae bacterium]
MAIIKEVDKTGNSAASLTISLSKDEVKSNYDAYLKDMLKDLQLPGFRRGKVPREVLERKAGSALKDDVLARLIGETSRSIFEKEDFPKEFLPLPFADPELKGEPKLDLESDLDFTIVYDIKPVFDIKSWEGFTIEVDKASIQADDVQRELDAIRERNAIVRDREEGEKSQKGDVVTVNFAEIDDNGGLIQATKREDFVFEIGSKRNFYQFDDEVTGMKAGEERDIEKSYPSDFEFKDLSGKTKKIRVKVTAVKRKEVPALDDEFAQDVDEKFSTLNDLKKDVREKMQIQLDERLFALRNEAIIKKIAEDSPFELPKTLVDYELAESIYKMTGHFPQEGFRRILEQNSNFAEMMRPKAELAVRLRLIIEKLMEKINIEVNGEELEAEFKLYAERSSESIEKVKDYFSEKPEARESIERAIKERKLFEFLASKNTIKTGKKVRYVDLFPNIA